MIAVAQNTQEAGSTAWQEGFLKMLPMIERYARFAFRTLDPEAKEDAVSEVVANAFCAYRRLHQRGKLQRAFASVLARYAIAQFREGRRVGTPQSSRDLYSALARKRAGYEILSLGAPGNQVGEWMECLIDKKRTPVPEQVAFILDFPRWLDTQSSRNRQIIQRLLHGHSTGEVAREFKISSARVSQLRRDLADSWYKFIIAALAQSADDDRDSQHPRRADSLLSVI